MPLTEHFTDSHWHDPLKSKILRTTLFQKICSLLKFKAGAAKVSIGRQYFLQLKLYHFIDIVTITKYTVATRLGHITARGITAHGMTARRMTAHSMTARDIICRVEDLKGENNLRRNETIKSKNI